MLFIFLPAVASAIWWIEDVDAPKYFSNFKSRVIALDTSGGPHIAYGGDHLYHAYFDGTQWQYEVVDNTGGVGAVDSIAVDSNDLVYQLLSIIQDVRFSRQVEVSTNVQYINSFLFF